METETERFSRQPDLFVGRCSVHFFFFLHFGGNSIIVGSHSNHVVIASPTLLFLSRGHLDIFYNCYNRWSSTKQEQRLGKESYTMSGLAERPARG